jgi:2-hydroxy-3-keto-5-methylthiopentenyl-1-phosphate phosphatase
MKRIYFSDFDGTITKLDTTDAMVRAFAREGWQESMRKWEKGILSTEESAREVFRLFRVTKEELADFLENIPIDETFRDFVTYVETRQEKLYILSDGFDFNLNLILHKAELAHLPTYSNHLIINNNKYDLQSPFSSQCGKCGTCKKTLVESLKEAVEEIIYIGDGYSDICGSQAADIIFAKGHLLQHCRAQGIPVQPFTSFADITHWLRKH